MTKQYSIAEARNRLPGIVHDVERNGPVELTRRGKPVAVMLSVQEYRRLTNGAGGFWQAYQQWRRTVNWDEWDDGVVDEILASRDRSPGREFSWPN